MFSSVKWDPPSWVCACLTVRIQEMEVAMLPKSRLWRRVSGAGWGQGAVPALSGWERLRVTISLMRAGRRAGLESWARPDPRRLLSRVCGESGRVCGGPETQGSLARVAKKQGCHPKRGCPGGAQETPRGRTLGSQTRTKPNRTLRSVGPCPGKEARGGPRSEPKARPTHRPHPGQAGCRGLPPRTGEDLKVLAGVTPTLKPGGGDSPSLEGQWTEPRN